MKPHKNSGEVLISANIKGIGSGSFRTEVVNSLEQKQIKLFSPTGENSILINRDGSFDLFIVALDASDRPKTIESEKKYLITPSNGIVNIEKKTTFSFATLQSESFSLVDGGSVVLKAAPIGENTNLNLKATKVFQTQLSSKVNVLMPVKNLDINKKNSIGKVQLVDIQGNPFESFNDLRVKISSSDKTVIQTIQDVTIKKGESYTEFPITTKGKLGSSIISTSARGTVGTQFEVKTVTSSSSLSVSTSGLQEPMPVNEEIEVKIFVDDTNNDSIPGATVTIIPNANATTSVDVVRTGSDGSATFGLTALNGPEISIEFDASAPGYKDGRKTIDIAVDTPLGGLQEVTLPTELIYVIVVGIAIAIIAVILFFRKSKEPIDDEEEPWEDDDI